jgi:hypothetical protein
MRAPLRRSEIRAVAQPVFPPAVLPLVRFAALQSFDMRRAGRVHRIPCCRLALTFSGGACGSSLYAVPRDLAIPGSSSRTLHAPSESSASDPPQASRPRAPPVGFASPSSRHQLQASLRRDSKPAVYPSSAFLTPSTVSSAHCLAGLFHPATTSRVLPPRVCSSRTAVPARHRPVLPSRRWRRSTTGSCPPAPSPDAPPSGLCSVRESATDAPVLPMAPARSLRGLSSSRFSVFVPPRNE